MSSKPIDKNASTPAGTHQDLPASRDVSDMDSAGAIVNAIAEQFDAGATAVAIHDYDGHTARITDAGDIEAAGDAVVISGDDGQTATIPAAAIATIAGTDNSLAAIPLDAELTVTYHAQQSQHGTQTRTGRVSDWVAKRSGAVYKLSIETEGGVTYHVWTTTGCVDKGSRWSERKVGHDAEVDIHDSEVTA
ncbi:hypothetical protein [Halorussus marinus]|uniref:hypothetical protein n=1 Tax=Halorussus marinus TaxID=2505976 RepID=UPI0010927F3D|nr:hypothetical protein [Halorussus marinus]